MPESGGETLASLLTPRLQDGAAGTITHAMSEAMPSLTSTHLWLIRSFHEKTFFERSGIGPQVTTATYLVKAEAAVGARIGSGSRRPRRIELGREKNLRPQSEETRVGASSQILENIKSSWAYFLRYHSARCPQRRFSRS